MTLAAINPDDLTDWQARRIRQLYSRLQDTIAQSRSANQADIDRLHALRRAFTNIPRRFLHDLSEYELRTYTLAILRDIAELEERSLDVDQLRQATTNLRERQQQISLLFEQHQARRELRRRDRENRQESRRQGTEARRADQTSRIPRILREVSSSSRTESDCTICGDAYGSSSPGKTPERAVALDCGHQFGVDCITTWLSENTTCPLCRRDFADELTGGPRPRTGVRIR